MKMFSNGVGMIPSTLKLDFRYLNSTPYHLQRQHLALSPQQNLGTMYHSLSFFYLYSFLFSPHSNGNPDYDTWLFEITFIFCPYPTHNG